MKKILILTLIIILLPAILPAQDFTTRIADLDAYLNGPGLHSPHSPPPPSTVFRSLVGGVSGEVVVACNDLDGALYAEARLPGRGDTAHRFVHNGKPSWGAYNQRWRWQFRAIAYLIQCESGVDVRVDALAWLGPEWSDEFLAQWRPADYVSGVPHPQEHFDEDGDALWGFQFKIRDRDAYQVGPQAFLAATREAARLYPDGATLQQVVTIAAARIAHELAGEKFLRHSLEYNRLLDLAHEINDRELLPVPEFITSCASCALAPASPDPVPPSSPPGDAPAPVPPAPPAEPDGAWSFSPTRQHSRLARGVETPGRIQVRITGLLDLMALARRDAWPRKHNVTLLWATEDGWPPKWPKVGGFLIFYPASGQICFRAGSGFDKPSRECSTPSTGRGRQKETLFTDDMSFTLTSAAGAATIVAVDNRSGSTIATFSASTGQVPPPTQAYYGNGCGPSEGCGDFERPLKMQEEIDEKLRIAHGVTYSGATP